jgi:hypothetical protein
MSTKTTTVTATLNGATRLNNSVNGNPTWMLHTSEGDLRTSSDTAVSYEVSNHTGRPEHSPSSWVGRRVTFSTTRAGRVWDWSLADES